MSDDYRCKLAIPNDHYLIEIDSSFEENDDWDTEIFIYDQLDPEGNFVARHEVVDQSHLRPPFETSIRCRKL